MTVEHFDPLDLTLAAVAEKATCVNKNLLRILIALVLEKLVALLLNRLTVPRTY